MPAEIGLQTADAEGEEIVVRLVIRAPVAHNHCWKSGLQAMSLCGSPVVVVGRLLRVEVVDPKVVVDLAVLANVGAVARGVEEGLPIPAAITTAVLSTRDGCACEGRQWSPVECAAADAQVLVSGTGRAQIGLERALLTGPGFP